MTEASYLDLPASELRKRNTLLKKDREAGLSGEEFEKKIRPLIKDDESIVAVTLCFADLEGKFHLLDYNKDYFFKSADNLTFDGSSIKGFSDLHESDLRLFPDWTSFRWLPASIFGSGKVLMFAFIGGQDGSLYDGDMRARLATLLKQLKQEKNQLVFMAPEIEGHLLSGVDAEQQYFRKIKTFELATKSGYFSSLPHDDLRMYIDELARALGMLGFENEKDHPEVAPAEFELNYRYTEALGAADQILLYKLIARQIAKSKGYTACFLPKPIVGINGNGMHTNISISENGKNIFYDGQKQGNISDTGNYFAAGILGHAKELCLVMNSSVNAFRRLDPHFEAPNDIKMSSNDRSSMIRIPLGNENSARLEIRSPSPDASPYLLTYSLIKAGLEGIENNMSIPELVEKLPSSIHEALEIYLQSSFMKSILGESVHRKYAELKVLVADRSPRELGTVVKTTELIFHHEIRNQYLWGQF